MDNIANLTKTATRLAALSLSILMMGTLIPALASESSDVSELTDTTDIVNEIYEGDNGDEKPDSITAIEIIIGKRIPDTVLEGDRPPHVYRPRTPIFHHHHPENEPVPPKITKHLLVDHPELNNNQGRIIRTPKSSNAAETLTH